MFSFYLLPANAVDLFITDDTPQLVFDDTDVVAPVPFGEWSFLGDQQRFYLNNHITGRLVLLISDTADMQLEMLATTFQIEDESNFAIVSVHRDAPELALDIRSNGDVSLAGGDVFIDAANGDVSFAGGGVFIDGDSPRIGIGTTTPTRGLEIKQGIPGMLFNDTSDNSADWYFGNNRNDLIFRIQDNDTGGPAGTQIMILDAQTGFVGVGAGTPTAKLHVMDGNLKVEQTTASTHAVINLATASSSWEIKQNGTTGRLTFFSPGGGAQTASFKFDPQAQENLFRVGVLAADTVDINGKLVISGTEVNVPDYVFDTDFPLESIEEHAKMMWQDKRLPALPGADAIGKDGVDVVQHQFGVLEELEKAHIYIEQLHTKNLSIEQQVEGMQQQIDALRQQNQRMEQLVTRLVTNQAEQVALN